LQLGHNECVYNPTRKPHYYSSRKPHCTQPGSRIAIQPGNRIITQPGSRIITQVGSRINCNPSRKPHCNSQLNPETALPQVRPVEFRYGTNSSPSTLDFCRALGEQELSRSRTGRGEGQSRFRLSSDLRNRLSPPVGNRTSECPCTGPHFFAAGWTCKSDGHGFSPPPPTSGDGGGAKCTNCRA
jgi:hypothetical protein